MLNALGDKTFFDHNPFDVVAKDLTLNGLEKIQKVILLQYEDAANVDIGIMSMPLLKNPRMLVELLESNQMIVAPLFQTLLEEGMEDGSIRPASAKSVSELFMLIGNFWTIPTIFPCTRQEFLDKIHLLKNLFEGIGIPNIDDAVLKGIIKMSDKLELK